jgi:hypothetical protein
MALGMGGGEKRLTVGQRLPMGVEQTDNLALYLAKTKLTALLDNITSVLVALIIQLPCWDPVGLENSSSSVSVGLFGFTSHQTRCRRRNLPDRLLNAALSILKGCFDWDHLTAMSSQAISLER